MSDKPRKVDIDPPELLDHIGIYLVRAAGVWKEQFAHDMAQNGYPWHQEARGAVLAHLGPSGIEQSALVTAMGVSKQAVQQLLDQLEKDGLIQRALSQTDRRSRRIELTALGLKDFKMRNQVKRAIENRWRERLGLHQFEELQQLLHQLTKE